MCKITAICLLAALLLNSSCCHSAVIGYTSHDEIKWINGAVFLRCPWSENSECQEHCSDPQTGGCWPSIAAGLRDHGANSICNDTLSNESRLFTTEIVRCVMEGGRIACHTQLGEMERPVYLGAQLLQGGQLRGSVSINGEERPATTGITASLYTPWDAPIGNLTTGLNFKLRVRCRRFARCDRLAVQLLVVKLRCT